MKLRVNGETEDVSPGAGVMDLLRARGQEGEVAVAVNGAFVPRSSYGEVALKEGDEVEIVAPMQGG